LTCDEWRRVAINSTAKSSDLAERPCFGRRSVGLLGRLRQLCFCYKKRRFPSFCPPQYSQRRQHPRHHWHQASRPHKLPRLQSRRQLHRQRHWNHHLHPRRNFDECKNSIKSCSAFPTGDDLVKDYRFTSANIFNNSWKSVSCGEISAGLSYQRP
jgi:hypothetical protein